MDIISNREINLGDIEGLSPKGLKRPNTLLEANTLKLRYKWQVHYFSTIKDQAGHVKAQEKLDIVKKWISELKNPSKSEPSKLSERDIEVQKLTIIENGVTDQTEEVPSIRDGLIAEKTELTETLSTITAEIKEVTDKKLAYQMASKKIFTLTRLKDQLFESNTIGSFGIAINELEMVAITLEKKLESLEGDLSKDIEFDKNAIKKELEIIKLKITPLKVNVFVKVILLIFTFGIFNRRRNKEKADLQMDLQRVVRILNSSVLQIDEKLKEVSEIFKKHSDAIGNNLAEVDLKLENLHREAESKKRQIKEIEVKISQIDGLPIQEEKVVQVVEKVVQEVVVPKVMGKASISESTKQKLVNYLSTINKSGTLALVSNKKVLATQAEDLAKEMDFFTYMDQVASDPNAKTSFKGICNQSPKAKVMLTQLQKTIQRESGTYNKDYDKKQIKSPEVMRSDIEYYAQKYGLNVDELEKLVKDVSIADEKTRVVKTKALTDYMIP